VGVATSRGVTSFHFALRRRAVNPAANTQSAIASSSDAKCRTWETMSRVSCATRSTRDGSYSTGLTRRRCRTPMFFMARTTPAMFTGSCGSTSTTQMLSSALIPEAEAE
jgi:hypothetical protein